MKQLVKIVPLEPYAFGTDQKFRYPGEKSTGKESYFLRSQAIPEQTTILGMLRFLVSKQKGLIHADFQYTKDEKQRLAAYIGPESFQFGKEKQEFGCIHKISPVFLMDSDGRYYVKNPFHNTENKKGYKPIIMSNRTVETSFGEIRLPEEKEYNAKRGHAEGYYNLSNGCIENDLFKCVFIPGNRKNNKISTDDCFFKKDFFLLKKGFCFAAFVDATEIFRTDIVFMGMGSNAFLLTSEADREDDLNECVKEAFSRDCNLSGDGDVWIYALSDLVVQCRQQDDVSNKEKKGYETFCIVEQKQTRNLKTVYSEPNRLSKLKLSECQRNIIQRGSVFFQSCSLNLENENCRQIGYNRIIELGGKRSASNDV